MTCCVNCKLFSIPFQTVLRTLNFCIGLIALIFFFIFVIFLKLFFFPWKCFVFLAMKLSCKKNISFIKGSDIVYLIETDADRKYHSLTIVLDASADLHFMRTFLQMELLSSDGKDDCNGRERLLCAPYYSFGYWFWQDKSKSFDINLHVRRMDGIEDSDVVTESQMLRCLSNVMYEPISYEKPMWELLYVPKFKYDKDADNQEPSHLCAYAFRGHHVYGDALTTMNFFFLKSLKTPIFSQIRQPQISMLHKLYILAAGLTEMGNYLLHPLSEKTPIFGPELSGDKLLCASELIDFELIRKIRKEHQMSVYSILITTVTDAMKKYFTGKTLDMPTSMRVLFNTTMKIPKEKNYSLSNNAVAWSVPITTTNNPQEEWFSKITKDVNHSLEFMVYLGKFVFPALFSLLNDSPFFFTKFVGRFPVIASILLVNIPASFQDISLDGKNLYGLLGFSPHHIKLGLSMCFITFGGKIRMGLCVDKALIGKREDAELIVKYWEERISELSSDLKIVLNV